jgi:hypothetical protein
MSYGSWLSSFFTLMVRLCSHLNLCLLLKLSFMLNVHRCLFLLVNDGNMVAAHLDRILTAYCEHSMFAIKQSYNSCFMWSC